MASTSDGESFCCGAKLLQDVQWHHRKQHPTSFRERRIRLRYEKVIAFKGIAYEGRSADEILEAAPYALFEAPNRLH